MKSKEKLVKKIKNLEWGNILWGYDQNGNIININDYDEETDTFNTYGEDFKCRKVKFEELPTKLYR